MNSIPFTFAVLVATCLVGLAFMVRRRQRCREAFLEMSPRYRSFFRESAITDVSDFLALAGQTPHIVSGHPDRNVSRITLAKDGAQGCVFLKREHRVTWRTRVGNYFAGFGLVSRSMREARMLQMLQREGMPGPEWLAAGEDGRGRAFLLVREAAGGELRSISATEKDPRQRRRIARKLGATLARLHSAGFHHHDLYANHLFVDPTSGSIHLIDWQRARLRRTLSWPERCRDLAALHATIDDVLATSEERLLCLRAYMRNSCLSDVSWRTAIQGVESQARSLLARRHIREKRQPPVPPQAWICLAGEALCVSPVFQERCGGLVPNYLPSRNGPVTTHPRLHRRWPALPDAARVQLVQRNQSKSLAKFWPLAQRSVVSPEQRQAALLLRLQRHAITAPQVLALGHRRGDNGQGESFLLTQPVADTCSLEAWLGYRTRRWRRDARPARCWSVLRQAGELLQRLHEASCYLNFGPSGCGFAVCKIRGRLTVVLDNVDCVTPMRRHHPRRASHDLWRIQQLLLSVGCSRGDLCRFRIGYLGESRKTPNPDTIPRSLDLRGNGNVPRSASPPVLSRSAGTRDSLWRRLLWGVRRFHHRPDWPRFAGGDWADRVMDLSVTDRFHAKQGRSIARWIMRRETADPEPERRLSVYLKRHNELPWWRGWLAAVWPWHHWSPAWREWQQLEWARQQGIPVPRTVAVAEYIGPWTRLRSFLAVEELAGMVSLQEAIPLAAVRQDSLSFRRWKRGLAAELARLTCVLHDRRCFHKDLYLCHFFISREDTRGVPIEGWRGRLHLIDLHRLAHHPLTWRLWQTKDLAQILYSSEIVGLDARDRLAFWRAYRGDGAHRERFPCLRRVILYRWQRYRRHNARAYQPMRDEPAWT